MIPAICAFYKESLVQDIVSSLVCDWHLWSLDGNIPENLEHLVRGTGRKGKFEICNELMDRYWDYGELLIIDDDVRFPRGWLHKFLDLVHKTKADIAQPALTEDSYHTQALPLRLRQYEARLVNFVEIGPVVWMNKNFMFHALPFPETDLLGYHLDYYWQALCKSTGLRMMIIDAAPVEHKFREIGKLYKETVDSKEFFAKYGITPVRRGAVYCYGKGL